MGLVGFKGSLWLCLCHLHSHGHRKSRRKMWAFGVECGFVSSVPFGEPSEEWIHEYGEEEGGECASLQCASMDGHGGGIAVWCHVVCTGDFVELFTCVDVALRES